MFFFSIQNFSQNFSDLSNINFSDLNNSQIDLLLRRAHHRDIINLIIENG